jgi:hypothetical protein
LSLNFHLWWLKKRVLKLVGWNVGESARLGDMRDSLINHVIVILARKRIASRSLIFLTQNQETCKTITQQQLDNITLY